MGIRAAHRAARRTAIHHRALPRISALGGASEQRRRRERGGTGPGQCDRGPSLARTGGRRPVLAGKAEPVRPTHPEHAHRPIPRLPLWDLCAAGPGGSGLAARCRFVRRGCGRAFRDCARGGARLPGTASPDSRPARGANRVRARPETTGGARALLSAADGGRHQVGSVRVWPVSATRRHSSPGAESRSSFRRWLQWWRRGWR